MANGKKYLVTYEAIKADIYTKYKEGDFMPNEKTLMKKYNVSRTTLRRAMQMLKHDGIVRIQQGFGTQVIRHKTHVRDSFLLFHNVSEISGRFLDGKDEDISIIGAIVDKIAATEQIAAGLQIPYGTIVYRVERILLLGDQPMMILHNYFRTDLISDMERYSGQVEHLYNIYYTLKEQYGIQFSRGQESISAKQASFFDSRLLDIKPGSPLLTFTRVAYTGDGDQEETMEYSEWLGRPDLMEVVVTMKGPREFSNNKSE